ncbi:MAG: LysR family transcriptional regulator [Rhodanobacteraceae bacterium]|nr:LysR family transcriptional regulator [Rhodanobacteraceae bacterium]
MDQLEEMAVFTAVAEQGGFAAASRQLNLSAATVTRAVAALEQAIGAELFVRTTRFVRLTEVGQHYLDDCRRILRQVEEAEAQAAGAHLVPQGQLVLAAPTLFGQQLVVPVVVDFLAQYPSLAVRLLLVDRQVQLGEEGIDAAFRIGELPDSSLVAMPLGYVRRVVCASPGYLASRGYPSHPSELGAHHLVVSVADTRHDTWHFVDAGRTLDLTIQPRLTVSTNAAAIAAAEAGAGFTRVMSYQVAEALAQGRLERVLQPFEAKPLPVWLANLEGRRAAAKLRVFLTFARDRLHGHAALLG